MSPGELLREEIEETPEPLLIEVYHYLRFLKQKPADQSFNGLALSETTLARDWNHPEEDAAWADL